MQTTSISMKKCLDFSLLKQLDLISNTHTIHNIDSSDFDETGELHLTTEAKKLPYDQRVDESEPFTPVKQLKPRSDK